MKKEFKILSIDGGGIKGAYPALILKHLEEQYGGHISDYFDMICGTSTGGLIALGLTAKINASEIADIYLKHGKNIFSGSQTRLGRTFGSVVKQLFWKGKYLGKPLQGVLQDYFGDKTLGEANNLLCIPSFNLTLGMPRMFKFPHKEGKFTMDKNIKMVDAALATSAAPTYFPIHQIDQGLYVDGGVWANNPSICGLLEALDYFVGDGKEFDSYSLLSISCISQATGWKAGVKRNRSFLQWGNKLFQTSMDGQAYFTNFFMEKMVNYTNPKGHYYRIGSPELSPAQTNVISMDRSDNESLSLLEHLGNTSGHKYRNQDEIAYFFKSQKNYQTQ